jgi:ferredoxin
MAERAVNSASRCREFSLKIRRRFTVKMQIDSGRCQGHGRCYDIAPGLFGADEDGYGKVLGDGLVPPGQEREVGLVAANCPERAVTIAEEA